MDSERQKVQPAPFEKNWHELAMKRMLRLAAEEGYDVVAWTTGDQQAERYNIGGIVDSIERREHYNLGERDYRINVNGKGNQDLVTDDEGNVIRSLVADFRGKKLSDIVGKGMAQKMLQMSENDVISGEDIRVGGEGMKGFYDEILPRFMNKYGKKWGVKVEDMELPLLESTGVTAHSVEVTPEMKESVMEGQLMFSRTFSSSQRAVDAVDREGISALVGTENVSDFYKGIYEALPEQMRAEIVKRAWGSGLNFRTALRGYIADTAAKGFQNDETGLLRMVSSILQGYSEDGAPLGDKALEYILWRQGKDGQLTDFFDIARGSWMRSQVETEDEDEGLRFSRSPLSDEINAADAKAEAKAEEAQQRRDETKKALKGNLLTVAKAMTAQKEYDRSTVDSIVSLAKSLLKDQGVDRMSRIEIARMMGLVENSVGKTAKRVKENADTLVNLIVEHLIKSEEQKYNELVSKTGKRVNTTGVEVQGELDVRGQQLIQAYKAARKMKTSNEDDSLDESTIEGRMNALADDLVSENETTRKEAEIEYEALSLAKEYNETIEELEGEEIGLMNAIKDAAKEMRDGNLSKSDYLSTKKEIEDALRENRIEQIEAYRRLRGKLEGVLAGSIEAAAEFRQREKERVETIHHLANSDMEGLSASAEGKPKMGWLVNNPLAKILLSTLASFDQMLRLLGRKNVRGEGYLWSHFMKLWNAAQADFYTGKRDANKEMDAKVSEVFGKEGMKWSDLYAEDRKLGTVTVKWYDDGEMKEHKLTQGNLLYIYMVNKMSDGRMKLRKMGITEETVQAIARQMDPRFLEIADWMQGEFLVKLRNKYNAIHEREFGASMAAIEDYFPLRINKRSLSKQEDVAKADVEGLPSTATGSIIKRRKNAQPLDLLNANAFSVLAEHVDEMEKWASHVAFNKDVNALLSYKRFRNQLENMTTVYGAGERFRKAFYNAARLATDTYKPNRGNILDEGVTNAAKGVTAAKVSFRPFTALKQFLSLPAFIADTNPVYLAKSAATPWESWNWAMENLPVFEKRWKSRIAGDPRLMENESEWEFFQGDLYKWLSEVGMTPNAFIDALTVSIGAKAVYDTRYNQYIKDGYSEEMADEKAKLDATVIFNETQQSSEGAFVSTVQLDRTVGAIAVSVFRNSPMGFQRQLHDALRGISRHFRKGYKEESIAFMTKQMVREGLSEEQAKAAAERRYRRSLGRDAVRVATFGFTVQLAWNLGESIAYLIFGGDDDEKDAMFAEAARKALPGGLIEGLAGGNLLSDLIMTWKKGENIRNFDPSLLPLFSDVKRLIAMFGYDEVAAWNEVVNLGMQMATGVNLQTLTDGIVAVVDACDGDPETSREAMFMIMRIMEVPQSQLDQLYIDELGISGKHARSMSKAQLARRYAKYKMMKNAPVTGWAYSDKDKKKRMGTYEKRFDKKVKERKELKENSK